MQGFCRASFPLVHTHRCGIGLDFEFFEDGEFNGTGWAEKFLVAVGHMLKAQGRVVV